MNCCNTATMSGLQVDAAIISQLNAFLKEYCEQDALEIKSEHNVKIERFKRETEITNEAIEKIRERLGGLYEDKLDGIITKEQFVTYNKKFEKEISDLNNKLRAIELQVQSLHKTGYDTGFRQNLIKKYTNIDKLTRPIAEEFIDYVCVGAKTEGSEREITVHWSF